MNKAQLRAQMRDKRKSLTPQEQAHAQQALSERILRCENYLKARTVMAYVAVRGEIGLAPVMEDVLSSGRVLVLPRCEEPGVMTARIVQGMDDLVPGAYGVPEPGEHCEIADPKAIDLILAPGVAFDRAGHRLGQGGGYYDRFFSRSTAHRAGVCHDFALLDCVPCEAHDEKMDTVIMPGGIVTAGTQYDRRT